MIFFENLDLLSVGIVVAGTITLGFSVYLSNTKNATNKFFFWFALVTAAWGVVNYLNYQTQNYTQTLWIIRLVMFFAVWQAYTLFLLLYVFPKEQVSLKLFIKWPLLLIVILTSALTLTPFVFSGVILAPLGQVSQPVPNWGLVVFVVVAVSLVISGIVALLHKIITSTRDDRQRLMPILVGTGLMFALIIIFNLIAVIIFNTTRFIPLGALFVFPFIAFTSYAILQHNLFSVRAMWAGVLVFLLAITAFFEVIFAREISLVVYRGAVFILILSFGILLIKGIIREVRQREEIQNLANRLKSVNSILAHDVKGAFAKGRGAFSLLLQGSYGPIPEKARPLLESISNDWKKMLDAIINILAAGREMVLTVEPFNLKDTIAEVVKDTLRDAKAKRLTLNVDILDNVDYTIVADKNQLTTHVLKNLIENAVNYNLENGSVTVKLQKKDPETFLFSVADTGIGIKEEDRPNMFKEGGRGKESVKINVHSSGYGLATAKKTAEAHGGKIWFESDGVPGEGATFFVELPAVAKTDSQTNQLVLR